MAIPETETISCLLSLKSRETDTISEAQRRRDAIDIVLSLLQSEEPAPRQMSLDDLEPANVESGWRSKPVINLAGERNLIGRLIRLAQGWDGVIDAMEASEYLVAHGYSKSTPHLLRPHVYNALVDCPDFVKVGKGTFQYLADSGDSMTEGTCESGTTTI